MSNISKKELVSPKEVYNKLIDDEKVLTATGEISFKYSTVSITVKQKDVVGNILQEWLEGWLKANNFNYATNSNTQMPPDFFLDPENKRHNLLEVKAFNIEASPAFDIADFRMYEEEIIKEPWMLDSDYLIFGYKMEETGIVKVKNLWLKKVWEICAPSKDWPLKLQVKKQIISKLRPCKWYSKKGSFPVFSSKEDFVSAIEETVYRNPSTHNDGAEWRSKFEKAYKDFYKKDIIFPHWSDIKSKYSKIEL